MTPADRDKLARMTVIARSLKEATAAWEKGHLVEAGGLYSRADFAETRAHYFGLAVILAGDEAAASCDLRNFGAGRMML